MKITRMKTNRITNPLGFELALPRVSWVTEETDAQAQTAVQVQVAADEGFSNILHDSGRREDINSLAYPLPFELKPRTRYYWRVTVWADNGDTAQSDVAWFETSKLDQPWQAQWITPDWEDNKTHPMLRKEFKLPGDVVAARAYVCGVGLYEMEINGQRVTEERLTPFCNAYDRWIQYQTYDITPLLKTGDNAVGAMLGNGWYKGRFGFDGRKDAIYGDRFALLAELVITLAGGTTVTIVTDPTWKALRSPVTDSSIYDGETYDATCEVKGWSSAGLDDSAWQATRAIDLGFDKLEPRRSLPVLIMEEIKPVSVLQTPAGETVLDMGQNMVGWLRFPVNAPSGTKISLYHGEVLQNENFFNLNLRSAKAEYHFISNGEPAVAEPHFTFYGFRYVKVEGWPGEVTPETFTGCVVYSDMEETGHIETSNPLVNRLFLNAMWGQKGNFLDVPTDCPQRDERMGWTGDAQMFAGTACFNMDTAAFFSKYLYDMYKEQETRGGMVPMVIPAVGMPGGGSSAWGDAATIIPWTVYLHFGDKAILEQQLDSMKAWVDFIKSQDEKSGGHRLWTVGFHFGDWLSLDGADPKSPLGGTPEDFISSAYYYYSARLTAKAADALGKDDIAQEYDRLADEVLEAIHEEYFSPRGRLTINTQTAMVVSLFMGLVPPEHQERIRNTLRDKLRRDKMHLKTGFVGTPYLCRVLSENDSNDLAYTLLMNEDYPSWLYAIKLGATTIWERWNSLLPDGTISDLTMNSFNHYAYGSIVEWMYRNMLGIKPVEHRPGFRHAMIAPQPNNKLKWAKGSLNSAMGLYETGWSINEDGTLSFHLRVPFNATATMRLPDANPADITVNGKSLSGMGFYLKQEGEATVVDLPAGVWDFQYQPTRTYLPKLSSYSTLAELLDHPEAKEALAQAFPQFADVPEGMLRNQSQNSLREMVNHPFVPIKVEQLDKLDEQLAKVKVPF